MVERREPSLDIRHQQLEQNVPFGSRDHSSGIPALRSPAKYVASNKARIVGINTPKFLAAFKRAMLE